MSDEESGDLLSWYAIRTLPWQEERAAQNLRAWHVETLAPREKKLSYNQYTGKPTTLVKPLFPRYIFARFQARRLFNRIRYTRGIHSIVCFGSGPTPVDDAVIAVLCSRMDEEGFVKYGESFKPGDELLIKEGPLKDFIGIFEREMNDTDRVVVLLNTLNYQASTVVEKSFVEKVNSAGSCR